MSPPPPEAVDDFKRQQQESQTYVKNIGIEYRFGCYEEKRADSCQLLAEYFEAIDQNFKAAFGLFKRNCEEREYPKSCYKYAMYLLHGKECEPSFEKMIKPLEIACGGGMAPGCRYLGLVHWNGYESKAPDSEKAEKAMIKACDLEDPEACWLLSTWYLGSKAKFSQPPGSEGKAKRQLGTLDRQPEKALEYGIRACDQYIPQSCANVARMYRIGDGIPKNPDKAKEYIDKATDIIQTLKTNNEKPLFTG